MGQDRAATDATRFWDPESFMPDGQVCRVPLYVVGDGEGAYHMLCLFDLDRIGYGCILLVAHGIRTVSTG